MRSSPPSASWDLELPPVTLADRLACGLVIAAGAVAAMELAFRDEAALAVGVGLVASVLGTLQARSWTRSSARSPQRLQWAAGGELRIQDGSGPPRTVTLGPATRLLGPSVFLDLRVGEGAAARRYRKWLTRFDVPADRLRRWTVVLPSSGRVACS